MQIESLDDWREYSDILHHMGYTVFQFQFDIRSPEGFRALFILTGVLILRLLLTTRWHMTL